MNEIHGKKRLLQKEITRLQGDMNAFKMRIVNLDPLERPRHREMGQKVVKMLCIIVPTCM